MHSKLRALIQIFFKVTPVGGVSNISNVAKTQRQSLTGLTVKSTYERGIEMQQFISLF